MRHAEPGGLEDPRPFQNTQANEKSPVISPDGHLVVFASGQESDDHVDSLGYLHTNFKLSGDGESVLLTQSDGITVARSFVDFP